MEIADPSLLISLVQGLKRNSLDVGECMAQVAGPHSRGKVCMLHEVFIPLQSPICKSHKMYTPGAVRTLPEAVVCPQGPVIAVHHVVVKLCVRNGLHQTAGVSPRPAR